MTDCSPVHNRSISVKEFNAFHFASTSNTKSNFQLADTALCKSLAVKPNLKGALSTIFTTTTSHACFVFKLFWSSSSSITVPISGHTIIACFQFGLSSELAFKVSPMHGQSSMAFCLLSRRLCSSINQRLSQWRHDKCPKWVTWGIEEFWLKTALVTFCFGCLRDSLSIGLLRKVHYDLFDFCFLLFSLLF